MRRRDRVRIIEEIAERLQDEGFERIDFLLTQFGLPTQDSWFGSTQSYILDSLKDGSASDVLELAEHLMVPNIPSLEDDGVDNAPSAADRIWGSSPLRIFLSHLAVEKEFAARVQSGFARYGAASFVAHVDITPTKEWLSQIEIGLASCDLLVALMHDGFHASNWTDQEVGYVMGRQKPVYPVALGEMPYGFLGKYQAFLLAGQPAEHVANSVMTQIYADKTVSVKAAEALIYAIERSGSYARTRDLVEHLDKISNVSRAACERLVVAQKENSQVRDAWKARDPIASFLTRMGADDLVPKLAA